MQAVQTDGGSYDAELPLSFQLARNCLSCQVESDAEQYLADPFGEHACQIADVAGCVLVVAPIRSRRDRNNSFGISPRSLALKAKEPFLLFPIEREQGGKLQRAWLPTVQDGPDAGGACG